jgi:hypothetical protein
MMVCNEQNTEGGVHGLTEATFLVAGPRFEVKPPKYGADQIRTLQLLLAKRSRHVRWFCNLQLPNKKSRNKVLNQVSGQDMTREWQICLGCNAKFNIKKFKQANASKGRLRIPLKVTKIVRPTEKYITPLQFTAHISNTLKQNAS